ncbi:MAG: sodium/hydrogen exchanger [Rhodanobacteraceae bacterium]|jgi:CPA2 family monovalent cation:H+ antiporter-2|nr:MAG: sodium/hydrogen exchanger [Rhodanobacteraceae bacterium]
MHPSRGRDALHEIQFIRDLACVMLAAGVVVVIFPRLRLPVLLGYIVAGVLIGPHMPWRFLTDQRTMQSIANLGVVLLMFTLGLDSNLRKLRALGAGVMLAALVEVGFMLWLGIEIGRLAGLTGREALFLGGVICFSSTMIALRTVADRGWRGQGFVAGMIGMLVSEEVLTVVLITVLSAVAAGSADTADVAFMVLWRMLLFVAVALILGLLLLPRLLDRLAKRGRDEPLLVTALGICFGACLLAAWEGFSVALGAFLAGVVVAEARCSDRIVRLVRPVRDMFAAIFFVAIGLLLDPAEMLPWLWPALGLALAVIVGKTLACSAGAFVCAGRNAHDALRTGLTMAQIGEFSFVIASLGIAAGAVGKFLYPLTVTAAVACMLASPLLLRAEPAILGLLRRATPASVCALAQGYHEWIGGTTPARDNAMLAKMLRRLLWHIAVNLVLVCAVFGIGAFVSSMLPRWWPQLPLPPVARRSLIWAVALFVSLPMLIAVYRKADALGMLLAELGISEQVHGVRTAGLRRVLGKLVPLATLAGMALLVAALGSSILPPRGVLLALLGIGAFTVWFLWGALVRVHARMQAALRDLIEQEPQTPP